MPISATHTNGVIRSRLPVPHSSTSSSSPSNLKRTNDELRQHVSRLKAELDVERAKSRQIHRDKVADIKKLKDEYDKEKLIAQGSVVDKMKGEHELEIKKLRETLQKEKEIEIKQILRFKDEELRTTKKMMAEDKEFSLKEQDERIKRELGSRVKDGNNELENRLRQELNECKRQKSQTEEALKQKSASEAEKIDLIRRLKEDHEKENQRVLRDARIQIARNVQELKNAQKALNEKEQEISKREFELTRLEEVRDQLSEKIRNEQIENGLTKTDKEKELLLRNAELKRNLDEVSRKASLLEKESLIKKTESKDVESSPRSDHRVKELKKRNGELVNLARKLDEKAKRLQDEVKELKSKEPGTKSSSSSSSEAFESFKKSFTMQRARDLAENAKTLMTKNKEITKLKGTIADLEEQLKHKNVQVEDASETGKLEMIIHQIEKEKLKLEKQLAVQMSNEEKLESVRRKEEDMLHDRLESMETEKEQMEKEIEVQKSEARKLEDELERMQETSKQRDDLLEILKERNNECDSLGKDLKSAKEELEELENQFEDSEKKRKDLETQNERHGIMVSNLQRKLSEQSQKMVSLENLQHDYEALKERLSDAEEQCHVMQDQVEDFQGKVASYKNIEQKLKEQEEKCKVWERDYDYAVKQINKRDKEISELRETQQSMKESYEDEIGSLRAEISRLEDICVDLESKESDYKLILEAQKDGINRKKSCNHVYVQTSRPQSPTNSDRVFVTEKIASNVETAFVTNAGLDEFDDFLQQPNEKVDESSLPETEQDRSLKYEDDILNNASSRIAALAALSISDSDFSREDKQVDIDFEEDAHLSGGNNEGVNQKLDIPMKKPIAGSGLAHSDDTSDELSLSLDGFSDDEKEEVLPYDDEQLIESGKEYGMERTASKKRLKFQEKQNNNSDSSVFGPVTPKASVDSLAGESIQAVNENSEQDLCADRIDKLSVYIAKYTYDPLEHSPNDDPSLELALEAGDYIYIFGDADEDGFFTGELASGQRGLVPSNFVEKIADEGQLFPIAGSHEAYPGDESDEDLTEAEYLKMTPRPMSAPEVVDIFKGETSGDSEDEFFKKTGLPPPRKLKLERQLNNSVVISWLAPENISKDEIRGYSIKADGELKETVIGSDKTKAIVSEIPRDKVHRITVHCFDKDKKESPGSVAAITVGRGASAVPTDLCISSRTATSADLQWSCGNSSMMHVVHLDGNEIHVLKPGVDRFRITGLVPDHEYEVSVEARLSVDGQKKKDHSMVSKGLLFRTNKEDPPEPPLNVQARVIRKSASHEESSIDVSWLPVTITEKDPGRSCIVKGYKIYMNDNEVLFIDQPTADHAKIPVQSLALKDSAVEFIELWITTVSISGESAISNVVIVPVDKPLHRDIYSQAKKSAVESITTAEKNVDVNRGDPGTPQIRETGNKKDDGSNTSDDVAAKAKPTVIRYDVVDSEDSDSGDDGSEDEAAPDFSTEKKAVPVEDHPEAAPPAPTKEIPTQAVDENFPENLILPTIPMPDYPDLKPDKESTEAVDIPEADYPDAIEVKPRKHFPLEDLLSTSDSELSAIEEETVEDLLEYNKDGSPIDGPQKTYSLSKSDRGGLSPEAANKTFSFNSEDGKNKTYDLAEKNGKVSEKVSEKASEKASEKRSSLTTKDTLTFDSDDVVDLLDSDIVGVFPELPLDQDKDRPDAAGSKQSSNKGKDNDRAVSTAQVPVTDLSALSNSLDDVGLQGAKESRRGLSQKVDEPQCDDNGNDNGGDPPAKGTPARSNDQENINTLPARRKWDPNTRDSSTNIELAKEDVALGLASADQDGLVELHGLASTVKLNEGDHENEAAEDFDLSAVKGKIRNSSSPASPENLEAKGGIPPRDSSPTERTPKPGVFSVNVEIGKPMGQVLSEEDSAENDGLSGDDFDDEPIKIPSTSVHDLYTLNAVDSFDDSVVESDAEYAPTYVPTGAQSTPDALEHEAQGGDKKPDRKAFIEDLQNPAGSFPKEPAMNNNVSTGGSIDERIHKGEPVSSSQGDELADNGVNGIDEASNEDTRTNHVDDKTIANNVRVFIALFTYDPITMSPNTDGVDEELSFTEGDLIKVFGECDEDGFYYGELHGSRGFVPSNMVQEVSLGDFGNSLNIPPPPSADLTGDSQDHDSEGQEPRRQSLSNPAIAAEVKKEPVAKVTRKNSEGTATEGTTKQLETEEDQGVAKMEDIFARIENIDLEEKERDYRYISERDSIYCLPPRRMIALYDYDPAVSSPNVDSEVELPFNKGDILLVFGDMDEDGFFAAQTSGERGLVPSNFLEDCPLPSESEEFEINMGATSPSIQSSSRKSSAASISGASPVDSPKTKKKKGFLAKGKKIFSKLKGK